MNNLSSYFGLVDAKIRASDKDLIVIGHQEVGLDLFVATSSQNVLLSKMRKWLRLCGRLFGIKIVYFIFDL